MNTSAQRRMDMVLFTVSKSNKRLLGNNCDLINSFVCVLALQRDLPSFGSLNAINVLGLEFYFTKMFSQF